MPRMPSASLSRVARVRLWLEAHAFLASVVAGMTLAIVAVFITFRPPSGLPLSNADDLMSPAQWIWMVVVVILGFVTVWGTVTDHNASNRRQEERDRQQEIRDRKVDGVQLDVIDRFDELAASDDARGHLSRRAQLALRDEASQLAGEIERYLAARLEAAPFGVLDADTLVAHNRWHDENGHIYAARYAGRVKRTANAMARLGVADDFLIAQANQQYPYPTSTLYVIPGLLEKAAALL